MIGNNLLARLNIVLLWSLIGLILITFWQGILMLQDDWQLIKQPISLSQDSDALRQTRLAIQQLTEAHLFGESKLAKDAPITTLTLKVSGIIVAPTEHSSKVAIAIGDEASKIYHIGETLPDGVKIHQILSDAVILERDGRQETFRLPRETLQFKSREDQQ